jgi:hypothetical protein
MHTINVESTVTSVHSLLSEAAAASDAICFNPEVRGFEDMLEDRIERAIESAFLQLMMLTEALNLSGTHDRIESTYRQAKTAKDGLSAGTQGADGDPELLWYKPLRLFTKSIEAVYGLSGVQTVRKDLVEILRATQYAITDSRCFSATPQNEADVHNRIEAVLRCVFPDLLHKPLISKPIVNFIPDTGLPSIRTLVEYKFIQTPEQVGRIANEILADTRGYASNEWSSFVYMIYETSRLKPEAEWKQLLKQCLTAEHTEVIVICGEPVGEHKR